MKLFPSNLTASQNKAQEYLDMEKYSAPNKVKFTKHAKKQKNIYEEKNQPIKTNPELIKC